MLSTSTVADDIGTGLLLTDHYQLSMLQADLDAGMTDRAVFEFFLRKLRQRRKFLMAAGLQQVLDSLETAAFTPAALRDLAAAADRVRAQA